MPETRVYYAGSTVQAAKDRAVVRDREVPAATQLTKSATIADQEPRYLATSPTGSAVSIPKELFIALSDFMKTRKCPGSITIQFRRGEITCVEAVAKKTYRNS